MADEEKRLVSYTQINYVDLYETRAVRHGSGVSYGKKGARVYGGTSNSTQEWTNLGRGTLTLAGNKVFFVGGGQSRTIQLNKINQILTDPNNSVIEISVSNRQKSMRFALSGRTPKDAENVANAILSGQTSVVITELTKAPSGCYIATFVYGDYNAEQVLFLRDYRDNVLLQNALGKIFVDFYYTISPFLVKHFGNNIFRTTSKIILDKIIKKLQK